MSYLLLAVSVSIPMCLYLHSMSLSAHAKMISTELTFLLLLMSELALRRGSTASDTNSLSERMVQGSTRQIQVHAY